MTFKFSVEIKNPWEGGRGVNQGQHFPDICKLAYGI